MTPCTDHITISVICRFDCPVVYIVIIWFLFLPMNGFKYYCTFVFFTSNLILDTFFNNCIVRHVVHVLLNVMKKQKYLQLVSEY